MEAPAKLAVSTEAAAAAKADPCRILELSLKFRQMKRN